MLEKNYGEKVNGMYLVCMHPNNKNGSYLKYKVPNLQEEINDLMKLRKEMVEKEPKKEPRKYFTVRDTSGNLLPIKLYYDD